MATHPHQRFIEGIKNRDEKIIQEVYNIFFPSIEKYILKNRGNLDDAYDVFQEGMQMLFREVTTKEFVIRTGLNNWLFMVCRNVWLKKLNKNAKIQVTSEADNDLISEEDTEGMMMDNERKQLYLKKFQQLSDGCQKVLTLFFQKIKMSEIAEKLNYKNANVVKKKKSECQKRLIQMVQSDPLFKELSF